MPSCDPKSVVRDIWAAVGGPEEALSSVTLTGDDPVLPSSFRIGLCAQASIAAAGLAAAWLWQLTTGRCQQVSVAARHAAAEFRSERYLRLDGRALPDPWDRIAGIYRSRDETWVRIHTNYPHHRDGILKLLACDYDRVAVEQSLARWHGEEFERRAAAAGLCAALCRSRAEWDRHPQAAAIASAPLVSLRRIGDAPAEPAGRGARPLSGIRVLDLTRVIAGPVGTRTLAAHGAEVLTVTSPNLPNQEPLILDTGRGKRSTFLDLEEPVACARLRDLIAGADIFVESYRPGALARKGFGPADVARLRPGIVYVSLSAYGAVGPWAGRRGFDSLVQTATGINHAEAASASSRMPTPLPCQALDHASGHLLACASMAGLAHRARQGGSWLAIVSLARTSKWLRELGRIPGGHDTPDQAFDDIAQFLEETDGPSGRVTAVRHAAIMGETATDKLSAAVPLGTHEPAWMNR
jgi:crotonobetainyl-CoA:carnitine CoA-transferase CaiB-like acyl-CoA transferase